MYIHENDRLLLFIMGQSLTYAVGYFVVQDLQPTAAAAK